MTPTKTYFQVLGEKLIQQVDRPGAVIVLPVNGYVKQDESAVMGIGYAQKFKKKYPGIEYAWGRELIKQGRAKGNFGEYKTGGLGNHVAIIHERAPIIVAFPTQWHFMHQYKKEPAPADYGLIDRSLCELAAMADYYKWHSIYLPKMGRDEGVTEWERNVLPLMRDYLDSRFTLCTL